METGEPAGSAAGTDTTTTATTATTATTTAATAATTATATTTATTTATATTTVPTASTAATSVTAPTVTAAATATTAPVTVAAPTTINTPTTVTATTTGDDDCDGVGSTGNNGDPGSSRGSGVGDDVGGGSEALSDTSKLGTVASPRVAAAGVSSNGIVSAVASTPTDAVTNEDWMTIGVDRGTNIDSLVGVSQAPKYCGRGGDTGGWTAYLTVDDDANTVTHNLGVYRSISQAITVHDMEALRVFGLEAGPYLNNTYEICQTAEKCAGTMMRFMVKAGDGE
jgi:hypothetical protein